jgi:hypothetical protein
MATVSHSIMPVISGAYASTFARSIKREFEGILDENVDYSLSRINHKFFRVILAPGQSTDAILTFLVKLDDNKIHVRMSWTCGNASASFRTSYPLDMNPEKLGMLEASRAEINGLVVHEDTLLERGYLFRIPFQNN